jgi:uncharacterized protein (DUF488 family)
MLTVGHSTRPIQEFIGLLQAHGVETLVDVRTIAKSRHNPQFNSDTLAASLGEAGIAYRHIPGLGGLRHARKDSINTGWRNASFRGFADYMQTEGFENGLGELLELEGARTVAIMCAESVPWRCHRSMIADALVARGVTVGHIMSATKMNSHTLTPFARVEGGRVTYPGEPLLN